MKLKEIKPGMVIHWKTKREKAALLEELERLGYEWYGTRKKPTETCNDKLIGHVIYIYNKDGWKHITHTDDTAYVTHEFSDLIIPEISAEEVVEWLCKHYCDSKFSEVFGGDFTIDGLYRVMTPDEIVRRIVQWKTEHEKKVKEPEIETVDICRIIEIKQDGFKKCVHEEDIKPDPELPFGSEQIAVEEILKRYCMEHNGEFMAMHEVVSRVKKNE